MWPDRRILDLFKIEHPILLGPMASAVDDKLAIAVAQGGGLGAIPCAMLTAEQLREQLGKFRAATKAPVNVNFFCHTPPVPNNAREVRWRERLKPYYEEFGIDPAAPVPQVVDAVKVPVIAAGAIADARGIVAAFALGAAAVQLGTTYLHCPESKITPLHRAALRAARDDGTALTNLHTGRPARGIVN